MNIGTLVVTLGVDATGLDKMTTHLNSVSQKFRTFGYLASATLTAPIVMASKASFQLAKDYEFAMQKIVGLTGEAQAAVSVWSDEILKLGPELARSPQELAEALYFISSSGIRGAEAMNVLKLSAKAATAGMGETQSMAQVLTSALNAYRDTGLTAAYATDVMVAAVREGKAEASGFATSMGQIIPIAAQLGVSFDQVAGGMAAITLTGASSANAAVYLKGVFNSLLTASTQGEKALNRMGSSYAELRQILGTQGLIPLMQKLRDMQKQWGDELLSDVLPNIRALTGYLSLAGKNFKYNTELMKRVTESTGSLGKAFSAVADTIKVRYDRAISQAQSSMISLGKSIAEAFLPLLEKLVKSLENLTTWFNNLSEAEQKNKLMILAITAALGPLSLMISLIGYLVSGAISLFGKLASAMKFLYANPYLAAGAAVISVVLALKRYANQIKEVAKEHDSFNTTLVKVNGTLQKLKDLTPADYGSMSMDELRKAQISVQQEWVKADKMYNQLIKNKEGFSGFEKFFGANKNNDKLIQQQIDKIGQLKMQYDSLGDTIYDTWKRSLIESEIKNTEKLKANLEAVKAEMIAINKWYLDRYDESMKKVGETTQSPFTGSVDFQKFFMMTSNFTAGEATFEQMNTYMSRAKVLASELTQVFTDLFMAIGQGWQSVIDVFVQGIKRLAAEIMSRVVVFGILSLISGGTSNLALGAKELIGGGLGDFLFKGLGRGMSAYANGTNSAFGGLSLVGERGPELVNLPRGAQVFPNYMLGAAMGGMNGEVRFVIEENQLVGILQKAGKRKSIY